MNTQNLELFFKSRSSEEQKELIGRLDRMLLAFKVNPDQEFINETIEDLFKDYPQIEKNV